MQILTDVVEGGMRLTVIHGPVLSSIILDPGDEDEIVGLLRQGFADVRAQENGHVFPG